MDNGDDCAFQIVSITLLVMLAVFTILMNGTCIYVISKSKELSQSPSTYLIRNLLFVHFIQGLVVFPFYAAKKANIDSILGYKIVCDGFRFTFMTTFYAAICSIFVIAIDRLIAVLAVMRYREIVTKRRVILVLAILWTYIISLCLIPFRYTQGNPDMQGFLQNMNSYNNDSNVSTVVGSNSNANLSNAIHSNVKCGYNQPRGWVMFMLIVNCLFPYISIVIIYQIVKRVILRIQSKTKTVGGRQPSGENRELEVNKHKRITKVSMILTIVYWITWLPSVLYYMLLCVCPNTCFIGGYKQSDLETYVGFVTKYLAFLDAVASPAIYCFLNETFRKMLFCNTG